MCGIVFLAGPRAGARVHGCLARIRHRGPDDQQVWAEGQMVLGFVRLAINGAGAAGIQPYQHGDLVGTINGEIYNHRALAAAHGLEPTSCDTHLVLPLLDRLGARVIDELDGFYAGVVLRPSTRELICLRDPVGKKPLFVGRSGRELFIISELKAFDEVEWFEPLPRGVCTVDLETGRVVQVAAHRPCRPEGGIVPLLEDAVRKRMPSADQPVGVFLSGGVDSSLVAALASRLRGDVICFTLGNPGGPDREAVEAVAAWLGLRDVRFVPLPESDRIQDLIRQVVYATESFNPSIVSNGLATYLLAQAAHAAGVKVVLTGEGADELFGGYHAFGPEAPWREVRRQLIDDMHLTELRRLDLSSMAHSVEARCPFLDRAVHGFSDGLSYPEMYDGDENKVTLRRRFDGVLPPEVLHRRKTSFDVGSGVRAEVVRHLRRRGRSEREELRDLWEQHFSFDASAAYFYAYPVFDDAIDRRGGAHR
jgi:asparagine synthase (glutamine-hydrolysing)